MTLPSLWSFLHTPIAELLGWTLLHVVWQGALVAAALAGALFLLRDHSPRLRYAVSCGALLGLLALPVGTALMLTGSVLPPSPSPSATTVEGAASLAATARTALEAPAAATGPSWGAWATARVQPALPWIVLAWGLGVIGFAVRLGGGAWRVRRLRRSSTPAPIEWRERLQALADRMGVREGVALRRSERVASPMLAGWWRPVILVPAGFLSGLPPSQVEALLLHELAHVRRHDVLVGRLQAVVETLLFFHPAAWWISQQVRRAREACCDDLVVQAGSGRKTYAQALAALAERAVEGTATTWAPAATDGSLLERIQRLVTPADAPATTGRRLSIVAAALLMVLVPAGLAACASQQSTTDGESAPPATTEAPDNSPETEAPAAPDAPATETQKETIVVIRDDSTERRTRFGTRGPVEVDNLDENVYVFRHGNRVDTIVVPDMEAFHPPISPDSLERVLRARINPDSIERTVRLRFDADSLEQRIFRMRVRADSIAQWFADRFSEEGGEPWHFRAGPDSVFSFEFDRDDFDLDVDSLRRWHEQHADSLRRHFEQLRKRMEREAPEQLREQARRLREQAERLEERAEEMEAPSPPPDSSG